MSTPRDLDSPNPAIERLDDWDDDLRRRYPAESPQRSHDAAAPGLKGEPSAFRDYRKAARAGVTEFYRLNHTYQTFDFVQAKRADYLRRTRRRMGIWEAMEFLNTLVDDSDPDTELPQLEHLLQTAESIRADGHPRWFILTGLIHDLGKVLCLFGEPQWAVVGDTFPVGCAFSEKIVFSEFFEQNPDRHDPRYQSACGIYSPGCGLDHVTMSWGHDEYLYHIVRDHLPDAALAMIRYHSFYPAHREGEYTHLMSDRDRAQFDWVRAFNPYDLYTKRDVRPDVPRLRPFYDDLIAEFFPATLAW